MPAAASAGYPVVAVLLGLGAAGVAAVVVAMAWNLHARQIRLAEMLARRQFLVTAPAAAPDRELNGHAGSSALAEIQEAQVAAGTRGSQGTPTAQKAQAPRGAATARTEKLVIEGPDTVAVGDQVRYRVRPSGNGKVVTWAVGGGSVSQSPDPAYPDELLLIADRPGDLIITVRVREGLTERREMKSVTAVPEAAPPAPPFPLRLFLQNWGLVTVAVLVVGFAAALVALGNLSSADFIALAVPLTAMLGVIAVVRGTSDPNPRPGRGGGPDR